MSVRRIPVLKPVLGISLLLSAFVAGGESLLLEAESFSDPGGWKADSQFIDEMGSTYMLAHGLGEPVADAVTEVEFPGKGKYHVFARCYNWTSPWYRGKGPGGFRVLVDGKPLPETLGEKGDSWEWQYAGVADIESSKTRISLSDLTGFDGRCDALYFTTDREDLPPSGKENLAEFRNCHRGFPETADGGRYDLVVVGGGIAGMSAAVSASRLGCKVALLHNRPVLGGNNSSEVRVHLGGALDVGKYPLLGSMQKEFGPSREGNARPAEYYEDDLKLGWIRNEEGVDLFLNLHVNEVETDSTGKILSVTGLDTMTGKRTRFAAPLFADCTGDGTVGYLAGAHYLIGREGRDEYGEPSAPAVGDSMTMGASVQWRTRDLLDNEKPGFPEFRYGLAFDDASCRRTDMGEWTWETGMHSDQLNGFERVRDYGMLVAYSNWSYLVNHIGMYPDRKLDWVAFVGGKRESRRLLGDYILKEDDLVKRVSHEDGSFAASWSIDLHFPDPENSRIFPDGAFIASNSHVFIHPYAVPYRCLYSRNVGNLFMAGRDISCTHVALGTVRVMRTTGMMGEVVGMAASLCRRHGASPRDIYQSYLPELRELMEMGVCRQGVTDNQNYNEGTHLPDDGY